MVTKKSTGNTIQIDNPSASEGSQFVDFKLTRSGTSLETQEFTYQTIDGSAKAGDDYQYISAATSFSQGETVKIISIKIIDDTFIENNESFSLSVTLLSNDSLIDSLSSLLNTNNMAGEQYISGTATIIDNDVAANRSPTINGLPTAAQIVTAGAPAALVDFTVADADNNNLTVTMTSTNGTLGGLTDANPSIVGIQLTGSASNINTTLEGATFTATTAGSASIAISVTDGLVANPTIGSYDFTVKADPSTNVNTDGLFISGTQGNDNLVGGIGNDFFKASPGFDHIYGEQGIDTVTYSGNRSSYNIENHTNGNFTVSGGAEGIDELSTIERLKFSDVQVAYDTQIGGVIGNAITMVNALFGKNSVQDKQLMGIAINFFETHKSLLSGIQSLLEIGIIEAFIGLRTDQFVYNILTNTRGNIDSLDSFNSLGTLYKVAANKPIADSIASVVENSIIQDSVYLIGYANSTGVEYII